jgi:hypothetical protein
MQRSRRKTLTVVLLACALLTLLIGLGAAFLMTPARQERSGPWFNVASLSSLHDNSVPQRVPVLAPHQDAWTRYPDQRLGYIFLRRPTGSEQVVALRGDHDSRFHIAVVYDEQAKLFRSVCWKVQFDMDGKEVSDGTYPLVGEDIELLPVRVFEDQVFVRYECP